MNIKISRSARACKQCGYIFRHEEPTSSVVRLELGQLLREDYCLPCRDAGAAAGAYSAWSPKFYDPAVADQEPEESFFPLRRLFYESVESEDRTVLAMAYLAGQLLRRQKVFRLIKETEDPDGGMILALFSDRIGNRLIEVRDPSLSHAELEQGRMLLLESLNRLEHPEETSPAEIDPAQTEETESTENAHSKPEPVET